MDLCKWIYRALAICLFGVLAPGCDSGDVITLIDRDPYMTHGTVTAMALRGGLPVEIHGAPFVGASAENVADALRLPAAFSAGLDFRAIAPGSWDYRNDHRLVLVFNSFDPPDARYHCLHQAQAPVYKPRGGGNFEVFAVFCRGERPFGQGLMRVANMRSDDWGAFANVMSRLLKEIIGDRRH